MKKADVQYLLDSKARQYNHPDFIGPDPISIPHRYSRHQDIEISGLLSATIAWGQRITIIKSASYLMELMDHAPYDFIMHHQEADLRKFTEFYHRTFQPTDILYFIEFLKNHYTNHSSLESAFTRGKSTYDRLTHLAHYFADHPYFPARTRKHVSNPSKGSSCKRLNMFLRWMVRRDDKGVDFGIWKNIQPSELICPLDVHVGRVARSLGLLKRKSNDWKAALELTEELRKFNPEDPVLYDYALFGMGLEG